MKKLVLAVMMAIVLAPICAFAWSDNFTPMSVADMKKTYCMTAIRLDFEVITSMHGSQRETIVRPVQPELNPPNYVFERMVITADSKYAGMIPVGTEVAYQYIRSATYESGPSELRDAAGISSFGGVKMIVKDSVIVSWAR